MNDRLVVLAEFDQRHKAEAARDFLEREGIESVIEADDAGGAYAGMGLSNPVRLLVREAEREEATSVLEQSPLGPA